MHPLHDYIAAQLAEKLKARKVVVWYDPRSEFAPFVVELRGGANVANAAASATVAGIATQVAEYDGSMFELRVAVEPFVSGDAPDHVLIYLPGCERDRRSSALMELEKAGECYEPQLKRLARNVLRQRYTDGVIDEMLAPEKVAYEDLARASSDASSGEPPSILKSMFHDAGRDGLLAAWLASDARDADIESKDAARELTKLVHSRLGLELPQDAGLPKLRSITLRYVLAGEFRSDLTSGAPACLDAVPVPATKNQEGAVRELAKRLRTDFGELYPAMADRVEGELGLRDAKIPADTLGSIDTFRFEEQTLLNRCGELIAATKFDEALALVLEREHSFWLDRNVERKAQWEACRRMAEVGRAAISVRAEVGKAGGDTSAWVTAYTVPNGWYRVDQAQRRLEAWIANLDDDPEERALGVVRRVYDDTINTMAEGFTKALVSGKWAVASSMHQSRIYSEVVAAQPRPVAYFFVDAMRFEMGVELSERLPKTAEVVVRHAIGALPSITPIGMAALQPGASSSFSVVEEGGKLGVRIADTFLPDLTARKKFAAARIPGLVDVSLDELLSLQASKLVKKVTGAQVIVVRSQEIDHAGEAGFMLHARQVMDTVIDNLARAIRRLAAAGVEYSVISADHGHLFASERDDSMKIDAPGGDQVDLHRRCWIGRGGSTPPGCVRVSASALGYESDLEFVFPSGCGVFKAGGDLAFHHGGASLQELIVPVLVVRTTRALNKTAGSPTLAVTAVPEAITNRIFSATLFLASLEMETVPVRPVLMAGEVQVGSVGMAVGAEYNRSAGTVTLVPGTEVTVGFVLDDDSAESLKIVILDPATDAELYRSPIAMPVRLGVG